jgi:hypothetical protein
LTKLGKLSYNGYGNSASWLVCNWKRQIFEAGIQETENERNSVSKWALGRQYLLYPINGTLKYYRFGKQDKRDPSVPSQKMSFTLNDVSLTVSEVMVFTLISFGFSHIYF